MLDQYLSIYKNFHFVLFSFLCLNWGCSNWSVKEKTNNRKAELYYTHGTENLVNKNYTDALKLLLKAHNLTPKDTRINNNLGMAYYFKGKREKAIEYIKTSIKLSPTNSDARNNLGSIYLNLGRYPEARAQYEKVREDLIYKHQYRIYYNLAIISHREGNIKKSINYLQKSLDDRKDYCPAFYKLGEINLSQNNLAKAMKFFKHASKGTCYNYPAPIYQQAQVWLKMNEMAKARKKFLEVQEKYPKTVFAKMATNKLKSMANNKIEKIDINSSPENNNLYHSPNF